MLIGAAAFAGDEAEAEAEAAFAGDEIAAAVAAGVDAIA